MNDWERQHRQAQRCKEAYPPGTRIVLNHMSDPYRPVPKGMRGTVRLVDDMGTIHMNCWMILLGFRLLDLRSSIQNRNKRCSWIYEIS